MNYVVFIFKPRYQDKKQVLNFFVPLKSQISNLLSSRLSDEDFVSKFHLSRLLHAEVHTKEWRRPKDFLLLGILTEAIQKLDIFTAGVRKS